MLGASRTMAARVAAVSKIVVAAGAFAAAVASMVVVALQVCAVSCKQDVWISILIARFVIHSRFFGEQPVHTWRWRDRIWTMLRW